MNSLFLETQRLYKDFLGNAVEYIKSTQDGIATESKDAFLEALQSSKRIFFTGAGSSIPGALFGALYSSSYRNLSAQYVPTGYILSEKLNSDDLVVLCTQGYNRGDSILVTKKVKSDGASLAVFTANKDSINISYADIVLPFDPFPEKLFCRPVGVVTCLEVLSAVLIKDFSVDKSLDAYSLGLSLEPLLFQRDCKYIVLASGWAVPVGFNFALALREGCGIDASFYDIETYGHGMYVSDQVWKIKGRNLKYLLINIAHNTHSKKAIDRILPFLRDTKSEYQIISSALEIPYAYFELLAYLSNSVYHSNEKNDYDMNNPPGKEESRSYHNEETYLL